MLILQRVWLISLSLVCHTLCSDAAYCLIRASRLVQGRRGRDEGEGTKLCGVHKDKMWCALIKIRAYAAKIAYSSETATLALENQFPQVKHCS